MVIFWQAHGHSSFGQPKLLKTKGKVWKVSLDGARWKSTIIDVACNAFCASIKQTKVKLGSKLQFPLWELRLNCQRENSTSSNESIS